MGFTGQRSRRLNLNVVSLLVFDLCTFRELAQHTLAATLQVSSLINAQQFLLVQWKSLKVKYSVLIRRAWLNPSTISLPRHYDNLAVN